MKEGKINIRIKQGIIPELVSGFSTHVVLKQSQQALKTLKQVQGLTNKTQHKNVGQVLPDNKGCSPRPMEGEGGRRPGEGLSFSPFLMEKGSRSGVSLTNKRGICFDDVRFTTDLHPKWRSAFTLIELLVVVLIIGLLAAIAVPQYQKAVLKAKTVEAMVFLDAFIKAEHIHYLTYGTYTFTLSRLDIGLDSYRPSVNGAEPNHYIQCNSTWRTCAVHINEKLLVQWFLPTEAAPQGKRQCWGQGGSVESKVCAALGQYSGQNGTWYIYDL